MQRAWRERLLPPQWLLLRGVVAVVVGVVAEVVLPLPQQLQQLELLPPRPGVWVPLTWSLFQLCRPLTGFCAALRVLQVMEG